MSAVTHVESMKWGRHASVTDVVDPASDYFLTPRNEVYAKYLRDTIDRSSVQLPDGSNAADKAGIDALSLSEMQFELRGLENGGPADGDTSATEGLELDDWLELIFGGVVNAKANTTSATPGAASTVTFGTAVDAARLGSAFLMEMTNGDMIAREAVSQSGSTATLESGPLNKDGSAGTWGASKLAKAARSFYIDPLASNRVPMGGDLQGDIDRYRYQGVTADGSIMMPEGDIAYLAINNAIASQVDREVTLPTITYAARGRGELICIDDGILWIGTTPYHFYNAQFNASNAMADRKNTAAKNNTSGRVYGKPRPTIKVSLPLGSLTTPAQTVETVLNDFRNMTEYNIGIQSGAAGGQCMYIRQPVSTAHLDDVINDGGVKVAVVTFTALSADSSATAFGSWPARAHFF